MFPRFFKQFSSPSSFAKILLLSGPTVERTYWRRLLRKSTTTNSSSNDDEISPPVSHNLTASQESMLTLNSKSTKSSSIPITEEDMPRALSPVHEQAKGGDVGSSPLKGLQSGTFLDVEEGRPNEGT